MRLTILMVMALSCYTHAQIITIKDNVTRQPLGFASVSTPSGDKSAISDARGQADISSFSPQDSIIIRMLGYIQAATVLENLRAASFKVFLSPDAMSLDEVVVSVTRWETESDEVPFKISSIRSKDMSLQNPQTAADMLGISGDIYIQKSQLGGGSPMIRGFATNRVLITVDGVRMNNAIFRAGNLQNVISIDPLATERTEILFGPGSVNYGSDAIGGVMSFYTLTPKLSSRDKPLITSNAMVRYASACNEKTGHAGFNIGLKKWAFVSSFTFTEFDDLKMGRNGPEENYLRKEYVEIINGIDSVLQNQDPLVQLHTGYSQWNLMQKVRFKPNKKWDIHCGFHHSLSSATPRYDRLVEYRNNRPRHSEWYYGAQLWMMNNLTIDHRTSGKLFDDLRFTFAHQLFEEGRTDRAFRNNNLRKTSERVDAFSANLDFEKQVGQKGTLYYGAEILMNIVGSSGESRDINTGLVQKINSRYPNGSSWDAYAVFSNYRHRVSPDFFILAGLRYNLVGLNASFDTTLFPYPAHSTRLRNTSPNGSLGFVYKLAHKFQVQSNVSSGFRAPNIDDIGKVFESEPGAIIVPNPDLRPEYAWNIDLGIEKTFGKKLKTGITGFYTILNDAQIRRPALLNGQDSIDYLGVRSQVISIQNAANAYVYGFQAEAEAKLPSGFRLMLKANYQFGEEELDDGTKAPLRHAAPWFGIARLSYEREKVLVEVYVVANGAVPYSRLAPSEREKIFIYARDQNGKPWSPAWHTLNFKAMHSIRDYLSVSLGIENITDQRYRPYSSGIVAPGRNFIISIRGSL